MRNSWMLAPSVVSAFLVGCATSYVDAQLPKVSYADLLARRDPRPVVLSVGFQRNGDPTMLGASRARRDIREVVERSKLFSSVIEKQTDTADQLDVVLNNVGDVGEAAAKGAKVGATFGASGALVTDAFVFTATFRPAGKEAVTKVYRHAMHSAVGSAEGPPGLVPMGPLQAFDKIIEDLMLNLLRDLQREELL